MDQVQLNRPASDASTVLTKAALRAVEELGITKREFAEIIGVSPAYVSKLSAGTAVLTPANKQGELATHFLRAFRSLDAIVGGKKHTAMEWLRNENTALGVVPIEALKTVRGLVDVVNYLDQRRAPL